MVYMCPCCSKGFTSWSGRNRHCIAKHNCRSRDGGVPEEIPPEQSEAVRAKVRVQSRQTFSCRPKSTSEGSASVWSPSCSDVRTPPSSRGLSGRPSLTRPRGDATDGGTNVAIEATAIEVTTIFTEERDAFTSEWFDPLSSPPPGWTGVIELEDWDDLLRRAPPEVAHVAVRGESWTSPVDAAT